MRIPDNWNNSSTRARGTPFNITTTQGQPDKDGCIGHVVVVCVCVCVCVCACVCVCVCVCGVWYVWCVVILYLELLVGDFWVRLEVFGHIHDNASNSKSVTLDHTSQRFLRPHANLNKCSVEFQAEMCELQCESTN